MSAADPRVKKSPEQNSQKELLLQVFLPLGVVVIAVVAVAVLVSLSSSPGDANVHHWANISVVLLTIPLSIQFLLALAVTAGLVFGVGKLTQWLPLPLKKLHLVFLKISLALWNAEQKMATPFVGVRSRTYGLRKGLKINKK